MPGNAAVVLVLLLTLVVLPIFRLDPNRVSTGPLVMLWQILPQEAPWFLALVLGCFLVLSISGLHRWGHLLLGLLMLGLWLLPGFAHLNRASPGPAFWLVHAICIGWMVVSPGTGRARRIASVLVMLAIGTGAGLMGLFDPVSLVQELGVLGDRLAAELVTHGVLSALAVGLALLLAVPMGLHAARRKGSSAFVRFAGLMQTIPSLALFGLLMLPLSALARALPVLKDLGISGIGAAPAVIGLGLYALLPLVVGIEQGIRSVPVEAVQAARGLGFTDVRILVDVEVPLAFPTIMAAFRTAVVQTLGNAALVPLIGAGGLGYFIFQGIGQTSTDMVLLGVITLLGLTLAVDTIIKTLHTPGKRRPHHARI